MSNYSTVDLKNAINMRNALEKYQDDMYMNLINKLNTQSNEILRGDLGSQFVSSCGRDLAGEIVRNFFNAADFHITVDQMATRILKFNYEDEYDPLKDNAQVHKNVYNYNEIVSSRLDEIAKDMEQNQAKLFDLARDDDNSDPKARREYRESQKRDGDTIYDQVTGKEGGGRYILKNGKKVWVSDLQADHIQNRAGATYNEKFIKEVGKEALQNFYNSINGKQWRER